MVWYSFSVLRHYVSWSVCHEPLGSGRSTIPLHRYTPFFLSGGSIASRASAAYICRTTKRSVENRRAVVNRVPQSRPIFFERASWRRKASPSVQIVFSTFPGFFHCFSCFF